ncbi:hypothetical protein [Nonomuraea spiralis]|nr:hypothetical protein [Nonomuraea spiralis]
MILTALRYTSHQLTHGDHPNDREDPFAEPSWWPLADLMAPADAAAFRSNDPSRRGHPARGGRNGLDGGDDDRLQGGVAARQWSARRASAEKPAISLYRCEISASSSTLITSVGRHVRRLDTDIAVPARA